MSEKRKKKRRWRKFWYVIEKISVVVTIFGIMSIGWSLYEINKKTKLEKADEKIIEAIGIFTAAKNLNEYYNSYRLFRKAHEDKPNDLTGYNLFFDKASKRIEDVKNANKGINKYDKKAELYLLYADSLNIYRNEAQNLLNDLQELKELGLINDEN